MNHLQKIIAIQTEDLPAFFGILEAKYGKKWTQKHMAFMAVLCEEAPSSIFQTAGYGDTTGYMKCAHSIIRSLARLAHEKEPRVAEIENVQIILKTLWDFIAADFAREGVPEKIFDAVMAERAEAEDDPISPSSLPPSPDAPPQDQSA